MRILFLTPELPNQLHRVRALNLVRGLGQRHDVDLVSLVHQPPRPEAVDALRPFCRHIDWVFQPRSRSLAQSAVGLFGAAPLEVCYERSPELARVVGQRLARHSYDLVYVKRLRMAQYAVDVVGLPRVLDLTDSMTRFYEQAWPRAPWPAKALFWEEWLKHRGYEPRLAAAFDRCLLASSADIHYLRQTLGVRHVELVPNPVDTGFFRPQPGADQAATFVLSGLMDKLVNVDAALYLYHDIWPLVRGALPGARLRLVGPKPSRVIRALDGRAGVEVVGLVPDLREELARATAVLVPLRLGTGTKNKVIQSLAMARPVVTTSVGNEGLGAVSGRHLMVADDAESFAAAAVQVHDDPALRAALGAAGQAWVSDCFGLPAVLARLERILTQVVDERRESANGPS